MAGNQRASADNLALIGAMAAMVIGVIIVAALYLGRDIFIPLALALLLSFVAGYPWFGPSSSPMFPERSQSSPL